MKVYKVQVHPDSKRMHIIETSPNHLNIYVRESALENRANKAARSALAGWLAIDESNIRLIAGHRKPNKIFEVRL